IINGVTDWVYDEEFSVVSAFDWNKSGEYLAYTRFDDTNVPEISMDVYGDTLYPTQHVFKYTTAGEENSKVSLHTYNLETSTTKTVDLKDAYYIPRIQWTEDEDVLSIQAINRHQNDLKLYFHKIDGQTQMVL